MIKKVSMEEIINNTRYGIIIERVTKKGSKVYQGLNINFIKNEIIDYNECYLISNCKVYDYIGYIKKNKYTFDYISLYKLF